MPKRLAVECALALAVLACAILALAGTFSNNSVSPSCGQAGDVFTYSVRYNLGPGDPVPTVTLHIYIQSELLTSVTFTSYNQGELWADYRANVQLDEANDFYKYKFTSTNGDQTMLFDGSRSRKTATTVRKGRIPVRRLKLVAQPLICTACVVKWFSIL